MNIMERSMDLILWETFNEVIGSREQVYIRQRRYCVDDIIRYKSQHMTPILSGSKAEGLDLAGSDHDIMIVWNNINIKQENYSQTLNSDLIMETMNMKPGFVKLILGLDKRGTGKLGGFASALTPVDNNRIYLSSLLFRDVVVSLTREHPLGTNAEPHGPCATYKLDDGLECDDMVCLRCGVWPFQAYEWTLRRRINNWPSQDMVKEIADEGCLLVPIGNPLSEESHIEWRISFSLAEKRLVHSMNHTQILCYGLLKLYLKHVIDTIEDCKGLLCSYFLKTALFYCIEEGDGVWDQHNILNCFWACFKLLFSWVRQGYCPNYFVKTNNMFESKIFGDTRGRLIVHLHNLYTVGVDTLVQMPVLAASFGRVMTITLTDVSIQKINEYRCDLEFFKISAPPLELFERIVLNIKLIEGLLALPDVPPVDYTYLKLCITHCYVYLTHHLYNSIINSGGSNTSKYKQLCQLSGHILRNCTGHGICIGLLQYATLNFLTGKYRKVIRIVQDVLTKFKCFVLYEGLTDLIEKANDYIHHMCGKGFSIEYKMRSALARQYICVVSCAFYPVEIEVEVKKYKNKYFDLIYIPPKIYCYVLLFLTYHRIGNVQLRNQTLEKLYDSTKDNHFIDEYEKPLVSALLARCVDIASPIP